MTGYFGVQLLLSTRVTFIRLRHLACKHHIVTKSKETKFRIGQLSWLITWHSQLFLDNKILVYKTIIRLTRTCEIQLWAQIAAVTLAFCESLNQRQFALRPMHRGLSLVLPYAKTCPSQQSRKGS